MNFLYVTDEKMKNTLLFQNFNLLHERKTKNNVIWVFENNPAINFTLFDKTKYVISNQLTF